MGNCLRKGFEQMEVNQMVKVVTTNGGIMELYAPITAECITKEFPGHSIYRGNDLISPPLLHNEALQGGHIYYLLPLNRNQNACSSLKLRPYRMSFDNQRLVKRSTEEEAEVSPRYNSNGVWKVKLVIKPEQLAEILQAQDARTEELIESVRTVAKCGSGNGNGSSSSTSVVISDQWSVCSGSWKESVANY